MSVLFYNGVDHMIEKITTLIKGKANNSHKHGNGDITSLDAGKITSGTINIDRLPHGALDRLIKVVDDTARFKLTTKDVQLGDSVKVTSTKKMYIVVDETKLSSEDGYEPYTADSATSVPWSGVTGKPNTYTPSSHTHTKSQITDFPTSMPASDVSAWAKASSKPSYSKSEVGLGNVDNTADSAKSVKYATSAGSASSASKATEVVDYGATTNTIQIGYSGKGATADNLTHIAGYIENGTRIKDVSKDTLKLWLGLGSLAYSSATIPTIPSSLPANGGNASTVNGHTVESNVPANAKFTDTNTWRPQPDWNATSGDAVILNKPTIPEEIVVDTALSSTSTNPVQNKVVNTELDKKADKEKYGDTIVSVGRKPDSTIGDNSFAFGDETTASGAYSHAEGLNTTASGNFSHAECWITTATGEGSHAEGHETTASGAYSHAEGHQNTASEYGSHTEGALNTASGYNSHAEGNSTTASGYASHTEGYNTTALDNQHAQGHFNNTTTATDNSVQGTSTGTAFVIGNGTGESSSNAFRVTGNGYVYATNATVQTGADYAEYFEWSDGNPDNEDRVGLFVTFDESNQEKIRIANSNDDYILGIVSGMPSVIGNGDEDWKKRYVLDDFGRYIQETFEYVIDGETKTGTKWKENPEYDSTKTYASRNERAEWSAIGLVGILSVYDDGTCQVNGYCKCKNNGIATASEKGADTYRVIKRVTDNIVKVVLK